MNSVPRIYLLLFLRASGSPYDTQFLVSAQAMEGKEKKRPTSVSSLTAASVSFFGFRPGFGFGGMTHSLEAEAGKRMNVERGMQPSVRVLTDGPQL